MDTSIERLSKIADPSLVNFKNSIIKDQKVNDLTSLVKTSLQNLPSNISYKQNSEFILYVCKLIENYIFKVDKLNKKEIVINILRSVLSLTDAECKMADGIIEFLHQNGMIHQVKVSKKINKSISNWVKKKIF